MQLFSEKINKQNVEKVFFSVTTAADLVVRTVACLENHLKPV